MERFEQTEFLIVIRFGGEMMTAGETNRKHFGKEVMHVLSIQPLVSRTNSNSETN
jgi:hypothetical protein